MAPDFGSNVADTIIIGCSRDKLGHEAAAIGRQQRYMWFEKKSLRRMAVAEDASPGQRFWKNITTRQWTFIAIAALCFAALLLLELIPNSKPVWLSAKAPATILSPVTFSVPDKAKFEALRLQARIRTNPVVQLNNKGKLLEIIGTELNSGAGGCRGQEPVRVVAGDYVGTVLKIGGKRRTSSDGACQVACGTIKCRDGIVGFAMKASF